MNNLLTNTAQDITNLLSQFEDQLNYSDYQTINHILTDLQLILQSYQYDNISDDELYDRAMISTGCGCGGGGGGGGGGGAGRGNGGNSGRRFR